MIFTYECTRSCCGCEYDMISTLLSSFTQPFCLSPSLCVYTLPFPPSLSASPSPSPPSSSPSPPSSLPPLPPTPYSVQGGSAEIQLKQGDRVKFSTDKRYYDCGDNETIYVDYVNIVNTTSVRDLIFIDDGLISVMVVEKGVDYLLTGLKNVLQCLGNQEYIDHVK